MRDGFTKISVLLFLMNVVLFATMITNLFFAIRGENVEGIMRSSFVLAMSTVAISILILTQGNISD